MTRRIENALLVVMVAVSGVLAAGNATPVPHVTGWRRILSFDMTKAATRSADIGNHTMLIAEGDSSRWDLEVRKYPLARNTENLMYDGNNWHGLQEWNLLPQFVTNNPCVSIVTYDKGRCQMMLVARGCERTAQNSNGVLFAKGTLEVFHKP